MSLTKIGCSTVNFRHQSLDEALRRIAAAGYEYVETQATAPFCPHVDPWNDDPEKFRKLIGNFGFKGVSALWAPHGAVMRDPDAVAGVTQAIQWASAAGIPVVNAGDGHKPGELSDQDALKRLGERLAEILEFAEQYGIYVAIEPHGTFSLTAEGLRAILALSPSPWLAVNYDAANVRRATYVETSAGKYSWIPYGEQQDEVATLRAVVDRTVHFHVKDLKQSSCVALGDGDVDNAGCFEVLRDSGYTGVISLETEGENSADDGQILIERSRQYLLATLVREAEEQQTR